MMVKNFRRYRKDMEREGNPIAAKNEDGKYLYLDFIPATYILPNEYALFLEEFHKGQNNTWIVKPATRSQGKGIFLLSRINQLKKITLNNFK
jgi:tubulin polyglutamylase TTLL1